jgi:NADH-quinone oxidoreductase subunit J
MAAAVGVTLVIEAVILTAMKGWTTPVVTTGTETTVGGTSNSEAIGDVLYSTYLFPFEVASLILLVAMIGAIMLAKKNILEVNSEG